VVTDAHDRLNEIRAGNCGEGSGLYSFRTRCGAPKIGSRHGALMRINGARSQRFSCAVQARFVHRFDDAKTQRGKPLIPCDGELTSAGRTASRA
jgi:hypothetical protein